MKKTKPAAARRPAARRTGRPADPVALSIRMYNVGFGDCFLIAIPGTPKRMILVDAGFHSHGKGAFAGNELAQQVLADVQAMTGKKRVDVVIATHRHQDHITTFNAAAWDELEVGEVWMPWVEDPGDPVATKLWKKRTSFALALTDALPGFSGLAPDNKQEIAFKLWNAGVPRDRLAAFAGWASADPTAEPGGWTNARALDRLHTGFARRDVEKPRFLPASATFPETFESAVLPGVRVYVLGPPRDAKLISTGNPEADGESYRALALVVAGDESDSGLPPPFGAQWVVGEPRPDNPIDKPLTDRETKELEDLSRDLDPVFAVEALDDMINATSLVLVLQIGAARLLLPGDAQWGTWKQILASPSAKALLKGTTFLKVGHHGSHNATPKDLVENLLASSVKAMISTQQGEGTFRNHIPLPELLDALTSHRIDHARSDRPGEAPKAFVIGNAARWIDLAIPM